MFTSQSDAYQAQRSQSNKPAKRGRPNKYQALSYVGKPNAVQVLNNRGSLSNATILTVRDNQAFIEYQVSNGATDNRNIRVIGAWSTHLSLKGANTESGKRLGLDGYGPLLGKVLETTAGQLIYVCVPELGADIRLMRVCEQDGLRLIVESLATGKRFAAYADQATTTERKPFRIIAHN